MFWPTISAIIRRYYKNVMGKMRHRPLHYIIIYPEIIILLYKRIIIKYFKRCCVSVGKLWVVEESFVTIKCWIYMCSRYLIKPNCQIKNQIRHSYIQYVCFISFFNHPVQSQEKCRVYIYVAFLLIGLAFYV